MKKIIPLVLCCCMMSGCSDRVSYDKNDSEVIETTAQNNTGNTTTSKVRTTDAMTTTSAKEIQKSVDSSYLEKTLHTPERYEFESNGNELHIYYISNELATITTEHELTDDNEVYMADFDFDNYYDIMIYDSNQSDILNSRKCEYWTWNVEKSEFVRSNALNILGDKGIGFDLGDNSLIAHYTEYIGTFTRRCTICLKLGNGKLIPVSLKKTYGESFIGQGAYEFNFFETFEADENNDLIMTERKITRNYSEDVFSVDNDPIYFRIADNDVECMRGNKVIQKISLPNAREINNSFLGITDPTQSCPICFDFITAMYDYDSDGYYDLRLVTETDEYGEPTSFKYYHYEPSAGMYSEWDELNNLAHGNEVSTDSNKIFCYERYYDDNTRKTTVSQYYWDNDRFVLQNQKSNINIDDENGYSSYDDYSNHNYDENGNDVKHVLHQAPKTVG